MMKHGGTMRRQLSCNLKKNSIQKWKQTSSNNAKKVVSDLAEVNINIDNHEQPLLQEISFDDTKSTLSSNSISSTLSLHRDDDENEPTTKPKKDKKSKNTAAAPSMNVMEMNDTTIMDRIGRRDGDVVVVVVDEEDYHCEKYTSNHHNSRRKLLIQNILMKHNQNHTTSSDNKQRLSLSSLQNKTNTSNNDNDNINGNGNDNDNSTTNDMSRNIHRSFSSSKLSIRRNTFHTNKATSRSNSVRDLSKTFHDRASLSFQKMMISNSGSTSQRRESSNQREHHQAEHHESNSHHAEDLPQKKEEPQRQPQRQQHPPKLKRTKKSQSFVYRSCPTTMIVIVATIAMMTIMSATTPMAVLAHPTEYNMSPLRREGSSQNGKDDSKTFDFINPFATDSMYSPMLDSLRVHGKKGTKHHSDQKMLSKYGYQHTWNSNEHGFLLPIPTKGKRRHSSLKTKKSKKKGSSNSNGDAGDDNAASNVSSDSTQDNHNNNNTSSSYLMTFDTITSLEECAQTCSTNDAISGGYNESKSKCYCHRKQRFENSGKKTSGKDDYKYCRELPSTIQMSSEVQIFTSLSNKPPKCPKSVCLHYYSQEYCQRSKKEVPPPGILELPPIPFESSDSLTEDNYYFDSTKYWYHQNSAVLQDSRGGYADENNRNGPAALTASTSSSATSLSPASTIILGSSIVITVITTLLLFVF